MRRILADEESELGVKIAQYRLSLVRMFLPLGVLANFYLLFWANRVPLKLTLFIQASTLFAMLYYLFAFWLWRTAELTVASGKRLRNSKWGVLIDVGFMTLFAIPIWTACSARGVHPPFMLFSVLLALPCLVYSFSLEPTGSHMLGWMTSVASLGIVHVITPASSFGTDTYATVVQYLIVCVFYFFIFRFGRLYSRRFYLLATRAASREVWRDRLARFLPPRAIERIERENGIRMGGESCKAAVLFVDIRGFTRLSETLEPSQVMQMLNDYFSRMVAVVFAHGGTVDKLMGDGLLAVFVQDAHLIDPAGAAVQTAIEMRKELAKMNTERIKRGESEIQTGAGIHFGPVIAGWMGSQLKPEYTVIGDTVNLASRIQGLTKRLANSILISRAAFDAMPSPKDLIHLGEHRLRGHHEPIEIYSIDAEVALASTNLKSAA